MAKPRVLITSPRLRPGDESVRLLEEAGFEPVYGHRHGAARKRRWLDRPGMGPRRLAVGHGPTPHRITDYIRS
ncbi:MAG: hypothetical protein ACM3US_16400 [Sphingomonadaceae bacterium]